MRSIKSIMPSISFDIVIRENIDPFLLGNILKGSVFIFRVKKFCFWIPNILIELRPIQKVFFNFLFSKL